jgi:tRNA-dihydrouridine synthase A
VPPFLSPPFLELGCQQRFEFFLAQLRPYIAEHLATGGSMHHITRHALGLGTGFPGARKFRQLLSVDIHKASDPLALLDKAGELLEGR